LATACRELKSAGCACLVQCGRSALARRRRDLTTARRLAREAVRLAGESWDPTDRTPALEELAAVVAACGEAERAAHLLGVVAALDEQAIGERRLATEQAAHDRLVDDVRCALGEAVFVAAWEAGRSRSLERGAPRKASSAAVTAAGFARCTRWPP
jgi:hypothetical protein